jgi:hypothetical protein
MLYTQVEQVVIRLLGILTYLGSEFVTYEKSVLNFDDPYHIAVLHFVLGLYLRLRSLIVLNFA